jgi:hypothetical protein
MIKCYIEHYGKSGYGRIEEAVVMKRKQICLRGAGLVLACLALFMAGPAWALPDLVAWVASRGVPVERGGELVIPFSVTVQNRGTDPALPFKVSVEYEIVSGGVSTLPPSGQAPFRVPGEANVWTPQTRAPLPPGPPPGSTVTFTGEVIMDRAFSAALIRLRAHADSTAGEEFADPAGHVRESDESNNATPWVDARMSAGTPDLAFRNQSPPGMFRLEGRYFMEDRSGGGFTFSVENRGTAPAGPFSVQVEYEILSGVGPDVARHGLLAYMPMGDRSLSSLSPRGIHRFDRLALKFPEGLDGATLRIRGRIDDGNTVAETDEGNNVGPWSSRFVLAREVERMSIPGTLILRTLGAALRGSIRINNFAGPTSDFQLDNEPFRRDDSWIRIGGTETRFTPPPFSYGSGATRSWYYVNEINAEFGGAGAPHFSEDRIAMEINFETGGDYEIRGWEYTWPWWYDSPPDFDLTMIRITLGLRPIIREGRLSYDHVMVATGIDLTLHGFWAFVDSGLLSNGIRDYLRNTLNSELHDRLEDELTSEDLRRRVEDELERAVVAPAMARLGIRRLLGVRVMGDHMEVSFQR